MNIRDELKALRDKWRNTAGATRALQAQECADELEAILSRHQDKAELEYRLVNAADAYQNHWVGASTSQLTELYKRFELAALALAEALREEQT